MEKNIDDADANAFRYCGEYYDAETGTIYLRARYYNPTTGRFISRDSYVGKISDPLSLNLYTYCYNNPLIYMDPSGHGPIKNFFKKVKEKVLNILGFKEISQDAMVTGKSEIRENTTTETTSQVTTSTRTTTTTTTTTTTANNKKWTTSRTNIDQFKIDFVETIYNKAKALEPTTKVPAAIVTAQACQETGYGVSIPVDKNTGKFSYNLFGIKGTGPSGTVLCDTFEYYNGQRYDIEDYFKAYNDYDESIVGHAEFLHENSNYDFLFESDDPVFWANGLQQAGYATDPDYAENLISVMNYWGLE